MPLFFPSTEIIQMVENTLTERPKHKFVYLLVGVTSDIMDFNCSFLFSSTFFMLPLKRGHLDLSLFVRAKIFHFVIKVEKCGHSCPMDTISIY